ncbi:hypothetical protein [Salegentibacter salinarum]|uniref:hypothetical protein n=1 Tax=Salegentibacter salinarum TaxID=447422 RepID=UPI001E4A98AE|nr:hypothetical protein [Salegentibacter salinarum]
MKKALLDIRDLNALKPVWRFKCCYFYNYFLILFRRSLLALAGFVVFSCNFETKKISSEEVLELESQTLNWKEVDEYPAFEDCQNETELIAARDCFEREVAENVYAYLSKQQPIVTESIDDTLYLYLEINSAGRPEIDSVKIDSTLNNQLPELRLWLDQSIDSLPKIYPASKRGVPVSTVFKMPIVIKAE